MAHLGRCWYVSNSSSNLCPRLYTLPILHNLGRIEERVIINLKNREADIIVRIANEFLVKQLECYDQLLLLFDYHGHIDWS